MSKNGSQPEPEPGVTQSNTPLETLKAARAVKMSWRQIKRQFPLFSPIPERTLWKWHETGVTPQKWAQHLGETVMKPAPACKCGEVHTKKGCPYEGKRTRDDDWYNTVQDIVSWANGEPWSGKRYARMRTLYRK